MSNHHHQPRFIYIIYTHAQGINSQYFLSSETYDKFKKNNLCYTKEKFTDDNQALHAMNSWGIKSLPAMIVAEYDSESEDGDEFEDAIIIENLHHYAQSYESLMNHLESMFS